jgi:LmbE family N-acetylglucosaminyl deacetylase
MNKAFFYVPHPDDELLSMGLAIVHYLASGYEVHVVSMSRGGVTPASVKLDGVSTCGYHGYVHDPVDEHYTVPSVEQISEARISEAHQSVGVMASISPTSTPGVVVHDEGNLADQYGGPTLPPSPEGIAAAKAVMKGFIDANPNSSHFTMSESDQHPDHAALGIALRQLKNDPVYGPPLANAKFFVSRLYWASSQASGQYPPEVLAASGNGATLQWYGSSSTAFQNRKAEYDALLRSAAKVYATWNPSVGLYAIGYHQVVNQFAKCFGPSASIANLCHT